MNMLRGKENDKETNSRMQEVPSTDRGAAYLHSVGAYHLFDLHVFLLVVLY